MTTSNANETVRTNESFIAPIAEGDLPGVEEMYKREGPEYKDNTAKALAHWYFHNPVKSHSLFGVRMNGGVEGFASTNNFYFRIGSEKRLAAFIQKVITLETIRGQGYFGRLLTELEKDNFGQGGASIMTGYPNDQAAPIYIKKFAYQWTEPLQVDLAPVAIFGKTQYTVLDSIDGVKQFTGVEQDCALVKDEAYFRWRYAAYPAGMLRILEIKRAGKVVAYAFLRTYVKMRLPLWALMDIILLDKEAMGHAVKQLRLFAGRSLRVGILYIHNDWFSPLQGQYRVIHTPKKIDFMMKGRNEEETVHLKGLCWNMWLGDTDFF